ncbi:DEAD/DEAH box helicase-like protein [Sulfurimonas denitrificans DSM 1251]|uniref:DEAD-box ATP-dependent RNA helicase RhpA n=1 Tax=Sulfurimonas denitrificans (strain ATCC 33889 / DSM 1251) TaxID=326298 RepID=Q30UM5_SULDN|nr:DEAD/DEAH box helicase [Sulfurimonas denitrificans]ABB43306.1 DEAD/DEAH box helicase-like protein [Sulfurimonas denitrificans DSM 1251]MDD3443343.1 DEAD/DEAH box helicase [Sulfurimonas denitrificans]
MSFTTLGLSAPILKAIKDQGYTKPTPIQKQAIPIILSKKDILAGAQTGTGKTAGFTLPLLELLSRDKSSTKKRIRALILTPTRELAAQVGESVSIYGKYLSFTSTIIYGGVSINPQLSALRKGVDIVIATPGRLLDHLSQKSIDLKDVEFLVLDEADRMLDMGFINDIKKVLAVLPKNKQTLLFSATYSDEIKKLSDRLLNSPVLIEVERPNKTAQSIKQIVYPVDKERKRELLVHLIKEGKWQQVLVFTRTKHGANKLSAQLEKDGISSSAIHGNKSQNARMKALQEFKDGDIRVLVATDIAARGIDIDQLPHVINYELPNVPEDYVHRIGRTGRAGSSGDAISLVCIDEHEYLSSIEKLIKTDIQKVWLKDFKPDPSIKAEPINQGGQRGSHKKRR